MPKRCALRPAASHPKGGHHILSSSSGSQTSAPEIKPPRLNEDWLSVLLGLLLFVFSFAVFFRLDLLGWAVTTAVWTSPMGALGPISKSYAGLPGLVYLAATYVFLLGLLAVGAAALNLNMIRFLKGFTAVFFTSYLAWFIGSWAYIAATPDNRQALGVPWSLSLTPEAGFIVALILGLALGNFWPSAVRAIKEAIRPELYIKTAIVILGGALGATAAEQLRLASAVMFQGVCAIIVAYLIFWAAVYYIARRYFRFSREWAAPLASGISICGVSAAIATGSAIRARPVIPVMVSSLVVIFAVVELVLLPFLAQTFLYHEPLVAGAFMGLAVKTDGAAVAAGAITEALVQAKALSVQGLHYQPGWIMGVSATVKVFIDAFIGVWAFVLAWIWSAKIENRSGERVRPREIWDRFPKFILGYVATFLIALGIGILSPALLAKTKVASAQANVFRGIFFTMTFFTIGVVSDFRKLWEEGIGRLALVYVLCLFGFVIWVALAISWLFFRGIRPPLA
jgi:uncharacterized membrane protein YadS